MEKLKNNKIEILHVMIIIIGIIFIGLSVFHSNLWFDESYSVGMANQTYKDIWTIGGNDVHPILYYWILHTLQIIFGNKIIIYRLFSAICIAILGILGFTHIKKDFGKRTGLLFSFFSYFLPVCSLYAGEIRMYSLGLLLGTIMCIYAYRIYKNNIKKCTFIFFALSSLTLAYTHYYGLILAGIINLLLFINLIKNKKERMQDLKKFIISAVIQVLLYLPWLVCFLTQLQSVSGGFWITLSFPSTLYEILTLHFQGNLSQNTGLLIAGIIYTYVAFLIIETKKEERKPAIWGLLIYLSIIILALIVSLIMLSVILLYRYLLIISGLIIFAISFFMDKDKNNIRIIVICCIIFLISLISNITLIKENYNLNNEECVTYVKNNIQDGDIIVYSNVINGANITMQISTEKENTSYFYNKDNWNVKEAYKAFSPYMEIRENLDDIIKECNGRIWVIESENTSELADEISKKYNLMKTQEKQFKQSYKQYSYTVELIER